MSVDPPVAVRFFGVLAEEGRLKTSARMAGIGEETACRWVRQRFVALCDDGCSVAEAKERSMLAAVWFCLLGVLWIALGPARLLADEPAGWVVALFIAAAVGWVVVAGAQMAGAIAHRRDEVSAPR